MSDYRTITDIAKDVRADLKQQLGKWKFSVRANDNSITVSLMSGPLPVMLEKDCITEKRGGDRDGSGYAQLNPYTFTNKFGYGREQLESNGVPLTAAGFSVMEKSAKILAAYHWDKSDTQTDYFCCAFYMHIEIGQWNKDYRVL